jgi:membrane associated rhomboid family serine protease
VKALGDERPDQPVWARQDAFPVAPPAWGWMDYKGRLHSCESEEALIEAIDGDRNAAMALVWSPAFPHMVLPEELRGATAAVLHSRRVLAGMDLADARDKIRWFSFLAGGLAAYLFYRAWSMAPAEAIAARLEISIRALVSSVSIGVALLMWLVFAFIPWYQARKRVKELDHWTAGDVAAAVPVLRFETWLEMQKASATRFLLGLIALVGVVQLMPGNSILAAGLMKDPQHREWWRLLTAPLMHGNLLHFMMNAAALVYLGRRIEVIAGWPHVFMVFLFSAWIGGECSLRFVELPSVGASGGLMGWLGFLIVFESLHGRLVPIKARRRLLAGVLLTGLIGLVGFRFIDNAAHLGGLVAGLVYALIVFPKSASAARPRPTWSDRIAGALAAMVLIFAMLIAMWKIIGAFG